MRFRLFQVASSALSGSYFAFRCFPSSGTTGVCPLDNSGSCKVHAPERPLGRILISRGCPMKRLIGIAILIVSFSVLSVSATLQGKSQGKGRGESNKPEVKE